MKLLIDILASLAIVSFVLLAVLGGTLDPHKYGPVSPVTGGTDPDTAPVEHGPNQESC